MTKADFQQHVAGAVAANTLITDKHDPAFLGMIWTGRSVLTPDMAQNLAGIIQSGNFTATEYVNTKKPQSPYYVEIVVNDPQYVVPGSGVAPGAAQPYIGLDRVIMFSGTQQGWHTCSESSSIISTKVANGDLIRIGQLA